MYTCTEIPHKNLEVPTDLIYSMKIAGTMTPGEAAEKAAMSWYDQDRQQVDRVTVRVAWMEHGSPVDAIYVVKFKRTVTTSVKELPTLNGTITPRDPDDLNTITKTRMLREIQAILWLQEDDSVWDADKEWDAATTARISTVLHSYGLCPCDECVHGGE